MTKNIYGNMYLSRHFKFRHYHTIIHPEALYATVYTLITYQNNNDKLELQGIERERDIGTNQERRP